VNSPPVVSIIPIEKNLLHVNGFIHAFVNDFIPAFVNGFIHAFDGDDSGFIVIIIVIVKEEGEVGGKHVTFFFIA
jgi:hypothetical protein